MSSLISVIVNCHNGEKYLEKCISSILNQKYENFKDEKIKYFYSNIKFSLYKARNEK